MNKKMRPSSTMSTQENIAKVYPILLFKAPVLNNINVLDSNRKQKNLQILGDERRTQKK